MALQVRVAVIRQDPGTERRSADMVLLRAVRIVHRDGREIERIPGEAGEGDVIAGLSDVADLERVGTKIERRVLGEPVERSAHRIGSVVAHDHEDLPLRRREPQGRVQVCGRIDRNAAGHIELIVADARDRAIERHVQVRTGVEGDAAAAQLADAAAESLPRLDAGAVVDGDRAGPARAADVALLYAAVLTALAGCTPSISPRWLTVVGPVYVFGPESVTTSPIARPPVP